LGEAEEVAEGGGEGGARRCRLGPELRARLLGLALAQAVDLDLPRAALEHLAADGDADQAVAAEDEDLLAGEVQAAFSSCVPPAALRRLILLALPWMPGDGATAMRWRVVAAVAPRDPAHCSGRRRAAPMRPRAYG